MILFLQLNLLSTPNCVTNQVNCIFLAANESRSLNFRLHTHSTNSILHKLKRPFFKFLLHSRYIFILNTQTSFQQPHTQIHKYTNTQIHHASFLQNLMNYNLLIVTNTYKHTCHFNFTFGGMYFCPWNCEDFCNFLPDLVSIFHLFSRLLCLYALI